MKFGGVVDSTCKTLAYQWKFPDGTTDTSAHPSKAFNDVGPHIVTLEAWCDGCSAPRKSATVEVNVNNPEIVLNHAPSGDYHILDNGDPYSMNIPTAIIWVEVVNGTDVVSAEWYQFTIWSDEGNAGQTALYYADAPTGYVNPQPVIDSGHITNSYWTIDFDQETLGLYGGHANKLMVTAFVNGKQISKTFDISFYVVGHALNWTPLTTYVNGLNYNGSTGEVLERLRVITRTIAYHECYQGTQFATQAMINAGLSTSHVRYPARSFDNGYGVMQLTAPPPTRQECWDWRANVSDGADRIRGFYNSAVQWNQSNGGLLTAADLRKQTYAYYNGGENGGGYFNSSQNKDGSWSVTPKDYDCSCQAGTTRKGRPRNNTSLPCAFSEVCYANTLFNDEK